MDGSHVFVRADLEKTSMLTLDAISELRNLPGPLALGIGVFDGVHLGHQAVVEATLRNAAEAGGTGVIVTFDPHPARILRPDASPRLLTSTTHKLQLLGGCGVQHVLLVKFDLTFATHSPEEFISQLAGNSVPLQAICVGEDWAFGRNRSGNVSLLRQMGKPLGFSVIAIPPVTIDGEIVSSTLVRRAVEAGEMALAEKYLGRPYTILGTVNRGKQLGRTMGYPTANLSAHSEQFPPNGVYAVAARLGVETFRGVANIGVRPSIENAEPGRLLEVHLHDFDRDIYGLDLEIRFAKFLRQEQKFPSLDALRDQIEHDSVAARDFFIGLDQK